MKFIPFLKRKPKAPLNRYEELQKAEYRSRRTRRRLMVVVSCFLCVYAVIFARLIYFGIKGGEIEEASGPAVEQSAARPDILDRNGRLLATDLKTYSLFAEPRRIIDVDETIELISTVLPNLDWQETYKKLKKKTGFAWIQRGLTPSQKEQIMALGIPGVGFRTEVRRFYPGGPTASHILGMVNVDNQGTAGMEKYIDRAGLRDLRGAGLCGETQLEPVKLSNEVRVQAIMRGVVGDGMQKYLAI